MVGASRSPDAEAVGRALSVLAVVVLLIAAGVLLFPSPLADAFFAAWVAGGVAVSVVGAVAAWTSRTPLVWVTALLLVGLSILGMWSVGFLVAPAALCLLGSAVLLRGTDRRERVRRAILADPPSAREAAAKTLVGAAFVVAGGGIAYAASVARPLFDACARETLPCAVENTHWDAVAATVVGLVVLAVGCRLVWTQAYAASVRSADRIR